MDGDRPARDDAWPGGEPRGRRDRRGHERLGADTRRHARRRVDRRAAGGPGEALEHLRRVRPAGGDPGRLPQDPHVRRRGRGPGVPRVGDRGARRGHGHDRGRGLEARADGLLRPPLPRALPRARRRGRRGRHRPGGVHALHRQRPLGAPAPGPGGGEPVLRRGREPMGLLRGRQGSLRTLAHRRSLGGRARRGAGRGLRHLREIDRGRMEDIRRRLPSLANRQPAAYRSPTGV